MRLKNFKILKGVLKSIIFIALFVPVISFADSYGFDDYGFRTEASSGKSKLEISAIDWEEFPSKGEVPLDKMWTVEFSDSVDMDEIEAIAIERGSEFIPVRISVIEDNKISVSPADGYTGNTKYTLKVFLGNGHNYKMDFTTVSEDRVIDTELNNVYINAQSLYINETVKGSFSEGDHTDFYKIEIPQDGLLDIAALQLEGGKLDIYLYGKDGDDDSYMAYDYCDTTCRIKKGLQAGTYYIKVNYSGCYGDYELSNSFVPQDADNDSAHYSYIKAQPLELNSVAEGHIGYVSGPDTGNYNDFYRIELPEDGKLEITALQLDGDELDLYLYGEDGDDDSYIAYDYNDTTCRVSKGLQAGTYYIKINYSGNYGGYELTSIFEPQAVKNDSAHYSYIKAEEIELNSTVEGHIGYVSGPDTGNYSDFYKVEIQKNGILDITAVQTDGGKLDIYLYGENGDDDSYIAHDSYDTTCMLSKELQAGTYYIKVYCSGSYGGYELTNSFE